MDRWQAWCPPGGLIDGKLMSALSAVFGDWSQRWFTKTGNTDARLSSGGAGLRPASSSQIFSLGQEGLVLMTSQKKRDVIACRLIGLVAPSRTPTSADAGLLDALSLHCLDDLLQRVGSLIGTTGDVKLMDRADLTKEVGAASLSVEFHGFTGGSVELCLSQELAARLRCALAPAPTPGPELTRIMAAASDERVAVSARLGAGELSFTDLSAMEAGDVILLDRACGERVDLAIHGGVVLAQCLELETSNGSLRLRFAGI
jgi:flagellar motor switch/type III secretory pathway protein FliN